MEKIGLEKVKYPKSTNSLFKNDFHHRIATVDLHIAYDERISQAGHERLFFDVYFDKIGSQRKQTGNVLQGKTRLYMGNANFIEPDGIFAYFDGSKVSLFLLEVSNMQDTKTVMEQITKYLFVSYKGIVGDKYKIPETAKVLIAFNRPELKKAVMEKV